MNQTNVTLPDSVLHKVLTFFVRRNEWHDEPFLLATPDDLENRQTLARASLVCKAWAKVARALLHLDFTFPYCPDGDEIVNVRMQALVCESGLLHQESASAIAEGLTLQYPPARGLDYPTFVSIVKSYRSLVRLHLTIAYDDGLQTLLKNLGPAGTSTLPTVQTLILDESPRVRVRGTLDHTFKLLSLFPRLVNLSIHIGRTSFGLSTQATISHSLIHLKRIRLSGIWAFIEAFLACTGSLPRLQEADLDYYRSDQSGTEDETRIVWSTICRLPALMTLRMRFNDADWHEYVQVPDLDNLDNLKTLTTSLLCKDNKAALRSLEVWPTRIETLTLTSLSIEAFHILERVLRHIPNWLPKLSRFSILAEAPQDLYDDEDRESAQKAVDKILTVLGYRKVITDIPNFVADVA